MAKRGRPAPHCAGRPAPHSAERNRGKRGAIGAPPRAAPGATPSRSPPPARCGAPDPDPPRGDGGDARAGLDTGSGEGRVKSLEPDAVPGASRHMPTTIRAKRGVGGKSSRLSMVRVVTSTVVPGGRNRVPAAEDRLELLVAGAVHYTHIGADLRKGRGRFRLTRLQAGHRAAPARVYPSRCDSWEI
jgi:hypothetical protein